jgi:hypothetical protein
MNNPDTIRERLQSLDDIELFRHGFTANFRDYEIEVNRQDGSFLYRFTHCVTAEVSTVLKDDTWTRSWDDIFTHPERDDAWGDNYTWVRYTVAYPGPTYHQGSARSSDWERRLGHPMHEASIETNVYKLTLVFHDLVISRIGDGRDLGIRIPLS